jgi:hypothetical protein
LFVEILVKGADRREITGWRRCENATLAVQLRYGLRIRDGATDAGERRRRAASRSQ